MPRVAKELSAVEVRRLTEPGTYAVGGVSGLILAVSSSEARSWVLRTKIGERRREIGLGGFPAVSLKSAREKATEIKEAIRSGTDPVAERVAARQAILAQQAEERAKAMTFEQAARECHSMREGEFRSAKHRKDWLSSLERFAFPSIGQLSVADIQLEHILEVLNPIWTTRTETATRVRQRLEAVLGWATVRKYRSGENPAQWKGNLEHTLTAPAKLKKQRKQHHKALHWADVPGFMVELRKMKGTAAKALEFIILTAARSGEVRLAKWSEFDLSAAIWEVPGERMKAGKPHRVPLSDQAVKLLKNLPTREDDEYLFKAPKGGPLSDMSISAVCRRMGVNAVPHGFRSSFKDWCRSSTSYADEVSELALAHVNSDATRAAYARDELLPKRAKLMAEWARFLEDPPQSAEVTPIREAG